MVDLLSRIKRGQSARVQSLCSNAREGGVGGGSSVHGRSGEQTVEESINLSEGSGMVDSTRSWSTDELDLIDRALELQLASRKPDDSIRAFVTVWMVRVGADVYVRSGAGYGGVSKWLPRASEAGSGMVRVDGRQWPAVFTHLDPSDPVHVEIDGAYVCKYGSSFGMTDPVTHQHTLRITPTPAARSL
jgi:hypothetical protein